MCLKIKKNIYKKKFNSKLPILNVGTNDEISIKSLAKIIAKNIGFTGKIIFDKRYPDGTFRKKLNSQKIHNLGWYPKIKFKVGLKKIIHDRKN